MMSYTIYTKNACIGDGLLKGRVEAWPDRELGEPKIEMWWVIDSNWETDCRPLLAAYGCGI